MILLDEIQTGDVSMFWMPCSISALNNPSLLLDPAVAVDVHPPEDVLCPLLRRLEATLDGGGLVGPHHGVDGVDDARHLLGLYCPVTVNIIHP